MGKIVAPIEPREIIKENTTGVHLEGSGRGQMMDRKTTYCYVISDYRRGLDW
jgi:hypothetical protein